MKPEDLDAQGETRANPPATVGAAQVAVRRPSGPGPFPCVILMHGCGGPQPYLFRYAKVVTEVGAAAILVDSYAARGIGRLEAHLTVCTGLRLRGAQRADDLFQVMEWLGGQPWADAARIGAAGWSHGGWTLMDALALAGRDPERAHRLAALKQVFLVYPYAGPPALTARRGWGTLRPEVTCVLAGRDQVVGWRSPKRALARLEADGVRVDHHLFDDATHAFDDDQASDPRTRFDPHLARRVEALLTSRTGRL